MKYAVLLIKNFGKNMETNQQFRANFRFIRNKGDLSKQYHEKTNKSKTQDTKLVLDQDTITTDP